jgi:hypothetical protein
MKKLINFLKFAFVGVLFWSCNNATTTTQKEALTFSKADTATIITLPFNGVNKQAYFHLTGAYNSAKKYNLWINMPGAGETVGALTLLKNAGPFQYIVDSTAMDTSLIIVAPQPNEAYITNAEMQSYITTLKSRYNINKIAVSGYSLGAQDWTNFLWASASNFKQVSAWFMSSSDPTTLPQFGGPTLYPAWFAQDSVYYDGVCGSADGFYQLQTALFDSISAYKPYPTPHYTVLSGVGHSSQSWGPYFSPYVFDPVTGLNKYQTFMKLYPVTNPTPVVPPVSPVVPSVTTKFLVRSCTTTDFVKKTFTVLNVYSDSSYTQNVTQ